MDYYDFYEDFSEFDQQVDEFKKSLMTSVKKEFLDKMSAIEKENQELQEVKRNWEKLKKEYLEKEYVLKEERSKAKMEARQERLSELMEEQKIVLYKAESTYLNRTKCNKCDDNRKINYVSPQGRQVSEYCDCHSPHIHYNPQKYSWYEFKLDDWDHQFRVWYKKLITSDGKEYFDGDPNSVNNVYDGKADYESVERYALYFKTEEECQKYCDWLNSKEK
jgi:hypothetical protein